MTARILLALGLAALLAIPATAAPRKQNFTAHLTGEAERPTPRDTPAQGQAIFHLNKDGTIDYRLFASNIENVTAAHIHCPAGEEAFTGFTGFAVFLYKDPNGAGSGRHDGVLSTGTFSGSIPCVGGTMTVLQAMRSGVAYVNVHTSDGVNDQQEPGDFPGGEIRGQIEPRG